MQRDLFLSLAVLFSAGVAAAQTAGSTGGFATLETLSNGPESSGAKPAASAKADFRPWRFFPACPVAMRLTQGGNGDLLAASAGKPADRGPTQMIRIVLLQNKSSKITAMNVVANGISLKPHYLSVSGDGRPEMSRPLHVDVADGDAPDEGAADLVLKGFTSVRSIDLKSLTYADGSTWTSGERVCRATPDLLMRVDAR